MKKKIVYLLISLVFLCIFIINICIENNNFFKTNITDLLVLASTIFIGTYYYEKNNSQAKLIEKYEQLLDHFQNELIREDRLKFLLESGDIEKVLLTLRQLNNTLTILKAKADKLNISNEIEKIEDNYNSYNGILSDHITAPEKVDFQSLERLCVNIANKCEEIRFKLL